MEIVISFDYLLQTSSLFLNTFGHLGLVSQYQRSSSYASPTVRGKVPRVQFVLHRVGTNKWIEDKSKNGTCERYEVGKRRSALIKEMLVQYYYRRISRCSTFFFVSKARLKERYPLSQMDIWYVSFILKFFPQNFFPGTDRLTDRQTDKPTDQPTDIWDYRSSLPELKNQNNQRV